MAYLTEEAIKIPSFSGHSFIQLKKLKHGNRDVTIEMDFKPMRKDGVMLYTAQTFDGRGDYIALSMRNGFVEFRYLQERNEIIAVFAILPFIG